jgi:hypothetical protein
MRHEIQRRPPRPPLRFDRRLLAALLAFAAVSAAAQPLVVTYRGPENPNDRRVDYDNEALRLALEHTRATDGDFRLVPSPAMNRKRAFEAARNDVYPNFVVVTSFESRFAEDRDIRWVRFPVDLGITGYRICFVSSAIKAEVARAAKNLATLKHYTHGQGADWTDTTILRENGFIVSPVSDYESLFRMVAARRFDLFCRGVNEFAEEYRSHRDLPGLSYDESFALVYPLPRFYFTHSGNRALADRIERGLKLAWRDGSLVALWHAKYGESIAFAKLSSRRVFRLENPLLQGLDFDFSKYLQDPLKNVAPAQKK